MKELMKELETMVNKATEKVNDGITKASEVVNDGIAKASEAVNESVKDISNKIEIERTKLDLKSQIGHHDRIVTKSYARLGEAYYTYLEENGSMASTNDIVEIIKANKKIINMLEKQLEELEPVEETVEEPAEEVTAEAVEETEVEGE